MDPHLSGLDDLGRRLHRRLIEILRQERDRHLVAPQTDFGRRHGLTPISIAEFERRTGMKLLPPDGEG